MDHPQDIKRQHEAVKMIKVTAILSIIFGSMGTLFALFMMITSTWGPTYDSDLIGGVIFDLFILIFWLAPHVFLIFSGIKLLSIPKEGLARGLIITTVVIGAIWNLILLIFAVINLSQMHYYPETKHSS